MIVEDTKIENRLPLNVGIDIGQVRDNTAICVTEVHQVDIGEVRYVAKPEMGKHNERGEWIAPKIFDPVLRTEYIIRFIKRLPLNTSYPDVAIYIANMIQNELFQHRDVRIFIDSTGVGRPIYDGLNREILLRQHNAKFVQQLGTGVKWQIGRYILQIKPISFVHGEKYNRKEGTLGKAFLVSKLQALFQERRVHGPNTPEMKATIDELLVYEIKVSDNGKGQYGAFKTGAHDDLATALGLSCMDDPYMEKVSYSERVF